MTTIPAWSEAFRGDLAEVAALPLHQAREWAFAGATGAGVRVAVIDSGVDTSHPQVGRVAGAVRIEESPGGLVAVGGDHEDLVGHGTACAAIIRSLAPHAELYSVRVLGGNLKGRGPLLLAGIEWAIAQGIHVANLSLSSKSEAMSALLREATDRAYFQGMSMVCAANNLPGPTYPSQFSSVVSVAAHSGKDPYAILTNPTPPVEFGAPGIDIDVAWLGGKSMVASGNSFAAPHVAGLITLLLSKHPGLSTAQVKAVLQTISQNAREA